MKKIRLTKGLVAVSAIAIATSLMISCNNHKEQQAQTNKKDVTMVFSKGEKVTNDNFTGTVYLNYLVETDTTHNVNIGSVTFEPGARTNWHYHKGGQILLVIE